VNAGDGDAEESLVETPRLRLMPLTSRFAADYDERECLAAEDHWSRYGFGHWAVLDRGSGAFLGSVEVHFAYDGVEGIASEEIEVGVEILPRYQRQGFASEAVAAVLEDAWRRTNVEFLVAYTGADNVVSTALLEKLGFGFRNFGRGRNGDSISIYQLPRPA
jgi:RimJ/RimL family protein N-acetyltransferase